MMGNNPEDGMPYAVQHHKDSILVKALTTHRFLVEPAVNRVTSPDVIRRVGGFMIYRFAIFAGLMAAPLAAQNAPASIETSATTEAAKATTTPLPVEAFAALPFVERAHVARRHHHVVSLFN
jgi:hypothetical protein